MPKNIVVCCDGTGDSFGPHKTNVIHTVEKTIHDSRQVVCYDPGVGTFNFLGKTRENRLALLLGKAFGYGIRKNITDAYRFLMHHYQPGDAVYLFGFSRGAFTTRALAGFLHKCGLLPEGADNLIPIASNLYHGRHNAQLAAEFKSTFCRACKPRFVGVWDTVASLGYFLGKKFNNCNLNYDVQSGCHAIAIDEQRRKFQVSLWNEKNKPAEQHIEQVWFAGVHSDIGGWYQQRGLSDITLLWMLKKAEKQGLLLVDDWKASLNPQPLGELHHSRVGLWRLWRPIKRSIPNGARIHESVLTRMQNDSSYQPQLPSDYQIEKTPRAYRPNSKCVAMLEKDFSPPWEKSTRKKTKASSRVAADDTAITRQPYP